MRKFIFVNVLVLLFLLALLEIICFVSYKIEYAPIIEKQSKVSDNPKLQKKILSVKYSLPLFLKWQDRILKYAGNINKKPVIVVGCSYADGVGLEKGQTLSAKINKISGRTVYSITLPGGGTSFVYDTLSDNELIKYVSDAEYIIYLFIDDHIRRNFNPIVSYFATRLVPQFKVKNDVLVKKNVIIPEIYSSFIVKKYLEKEAIRKYTDEKAHNLPMLMKLLEESVKETKNKYPNSKFIFIEFPQGDMDKENAEYYELTEEQISKIKSLGIIYINAEQLAGHKFRDAEKYRLEDRDHPKEIVWDELAPLIVKKLDL